MVFLAERYGNRRLFAGSLVLALALTLTALPLPAQAQGENPYGSLIQDMPEGSVPYIPGPGYGSPEDSQEQQVVDTICMQLWYDCRLDCERRTDVYSDERRECESRCGRERLRCEGY